MTLNQFAPRYNILGGDTMRIIKARIKGELFADVLIDDEDYDMVSQFTWKVNTSGHIQTTRLGKIILLHRLILNEDNPKVIIDHRDRNKLNCQKYNLRKTDYKGNARNRTSTGKTGHVGIELTPYGRYRARIKVGGKNISLGNYDNINDAIIARKQGELKYWRKQDNE